MSNYYQEENRIMRLIKSGDCAMNLDQIAEKTHLNKKDVEACLRNLESREKIYLVATLRMLIAIAK